MGEIKQSASTSTENQSGTNPAVAPCSQMNKVRRVTRPVDTLVDFLLAQESRGITHVHLDESAREGLRELHIRSKSEKVPNIPALQAVEEIQVSIPLKAIPTLSFPIEEVSKPAAKALPALTVTSGTPTEQLASLKLQAETWQPAIGLGTLRDTMVFATGNPEARLMLIGEAPGHYEEKEQQPFVGPAGQKLNDILTAMRISRADVYISNIVKFRPAMARQTTNNRKPTAEEMASCLPLVQAEISIVKPECIIALGGTAAEGLLNLSGTVTAMRNVWHDFGGIPVRVTYHPSYLLQSGGSSTVKRQVWEDMLAVMEKLNIPISDKQRGFFLQKP